MFGTIDYFINKGVKMKKEEFMKKYNLTEKQFYGEEVIKENLYLNGLTSLPEGFNIIVGGSLFLNGLKSIPEGFTPIVGWNLWLDGLKSLPKGFNPTVGENLYLNSLQSLLNGFNIIVGGSLFLDSLQSIPEGFNPTVGGNLWLDGLKSLPDGFNPIIGNSLYYDSFDKSIDIKTPNIEEKLVWRDGKYRVFDGVFCEVLEHKKNVYKVKIRDMIAYVVSNGEFYSHGETIKEAKENLLYKLSNRDCSEYKKWTLDTPITKEQAIKSYRAITGACEFGTRHFVESLDKKPRKLTPRKVIDLTVGQYGSSKYREFFIK